ncbi:MAG: hypothetical protein ACFFD2_00180 [Promethearchaeota archaeon]
MEVKIGKSLPRVDTINWNIVGVQVERDRVIGLGLYQCRITALPESFGQLESLRGLILSGNQLTALPDSLVPVTTFNLEKVTLLS